MIDYQNAKQNVDSILGLALPEQEEQRKPER